MSQHFMQPPSCDWIRQFQDSPPRAEQHGRWSTMAAQGHTSDHFSTHRPSRGASSSNTTSHLDSQDRIQTFASLHDKCVDLVDRSISLHRVMAGLFFESNALSPALEKQVFAFFR